MYANFTSYRSFLDILNDSQCLTLTPVYGDAKFGPINSRNCCRVAQGAEFV